VEAIKFRHVAVSASVLPIPSERELRQQFAWDF